MKLAVFLLISLFLHLLVFDLVTRASRDSHQLLPDPQKWLVDVSVMITDGVEPDRGLAPDSRSASPIKAAGQDEPKAEPSPGKAAPTTAVEAERSAVAERQLENPKDIAVTPPEPGIGEDGKSTGNAGEALARSSQEYERQSRAAFMSRVNQQFLFIKLKNFISTTRLSLRAMFAARLSEEQMASFKGGVCSVRLSYNEEGALRDASVYSEDAALKEVVEAASDWHSLPRPSQFTLPYKTLEIKLSFSETGLAIAIMPE